MKLHLTIVSSLVLVMSIVGLSPAEAALKAGETCPKVGTTEISPNGKGALVCLTVSGSRKWIFTPLPKGAGDATRQVKLWTATNAIPDDSLTRYHSQSSDAYVQERLTLAQQARDALVNQKTILTNQSSTLQAEIQGLPAQISTTQATVQTAEAKLDGPKREYQSLSSQASILGSQYASLDRARTVNLACELLEVFGVGGGCGTFNESNYFSVKSQYEIANSRADSAWQTYTVLYNDYKKKYDASVALRSRQNTARAELNKANADLGSVENAIPGAEAHLSASHAVIENLTNLKVTLAQFDAASARVRDLATKPLGSNWKKNFNQIARLQGVASLHQTAILEIYSAFRSQTGDLPDPQPTATPEPTPTPDTTEAGQ